MSDLDSDDDVQGGRNASILHGTLYTVPFVGIFAIAAVELRFAVKSPALVAVILLGSLTPLLACIWRGRQWWSKKQSATLSMHENGVVRITVANLGSAVSAATNTLYTCNGCTDGQME